MRRQDREVSERAKIDEVIERCDCLRLGAERGGWRVYCAFELRLRAGRACEVLFSQRDGGPESLDDRKRHQGGL